MAGYGRNYYGDNRGNRDSYGNRGYSYEDRDSRPQQGDERAFINKGSLFLRQKRSPKSPDVGGDITIGGDVLTYILDLMNKGEQMVKLELGGWRRRSRNGDDFTSLAVSIPFSERDNYGRNDRREPDERQMMRGGYREQSGRDQRQIIDNRPRRQQSGMTDEEFARGDELPDFMRDDGEPPF